MERSQEISLLGEMEMTHGQVLRMLLSEEALMGLIGGVIGLIFGVILARLFLSVMTSMSGYRLTFALPKENILAALSIAFLNSNWRLSYPPGAPRVRPFWRPSNKSEATHSGKL